MKKSLYLTLSVIFLSLLSCAGKQDSISPDTDPLEIQNNFMKWWEYYNKNIALSTDFTAFDNLSKRITKEEFLTQLTSGNFIPVKLISSDTSVCYKLYSLNDNSDKSIRTAIKSSSERIYNNFKMEGLPFPEFDFKDLNGNVFNNENTKGKTIVLKCWFINCHACIAEFPVLNDLAERYRNRKDVIFLSLALDSEIKLNDFLIKKPFKYSVVADQEEFITKILRVHEYPTHFIINNKGIIVKVVTDTGQMIPVLDKLMK